MDAKVNLEFEVLGAECGPCKQTIHSQGTEALKTFMQNHQIAPCDLGWFVKVVAPPEYCTGLEMFMKLELEE